jgi:beta-xylosidase
LKHPAKGDIGNRFGHRVAESKNGEPTMKRHELGRRDLLKSAGAAVVGLSAATLAGGASTAPATAEPGAPPKPRTSTPSPGRAASATRTPAATVAMRRAEELLRKMTIEEKAMQLSSVYPMGLLGAEGPIRSQLDAQLKHGIGHVAGLGTFGHKTPETIAKTVNAIQRYLVTETRLKIPAIFHNEALNGVVAPHFTHFPTAIGLAATWDPEALEEMAKIQRRQLRSVGLLQALAPVMDVARDARWGRVHETYGEDPYLVSAMSVAFTRGMQGDDLRKGVLATAKHFLGYAVTEAGQNMAATAVGPRELYDVYARPFEAAIRLAGLGSVMASYSEFEGVPIHVSHEVLTKLLRGRMGFTGTVVSDYVGVGWAQTRQRVAASPEEVGSLALAAGMDVELPMVHGYGPVLAKAVQSGKVSESQLNESVRRVLRDKFALGLFDNPYVAEDPIKLESLATEGKDLSQKLAAESVTLLKNEKGLLPLNRDIKKVAVIGPHADSVGIGFAAYTYPAALQLLGAMFGGGETSMAGVGDSSSAWLPAEAAAALKNELQDYLKVDVGDYVKRSYPAVSLAEAIRQLLPDAKVTAVAGTGVVPSEPTDIPAAVAAAKEADVVILAVGGRAAWAGKERTEGEGQDTANIDLPPQQVELINAVTAVGKPTVAVMAMGRPLGLAPVIDRLPAVLRVPADRRRHSQRLPRHARPPRCSPSATASGYTTFDYAPLKLERDTVDVGGELRLSLTRHQYGQAARDRGRAALRRRHGHRRDAPRAAAHRVRPARPGARRVEDRLLRGAHERARLHGTLRRHRHGARSGGGERRQQLERHPVQRQAHRHGKDARHQG